MNYALAGPDPAPPTLDQATRSRILQVLRRLCEEFGAEPGPAQAGPGAEDAGRPAVARLPRSPRLCGEDEKLVVGLRHGLATLARARSGDPSPVPSLEGALDGAEFVARGDLLAGRGDRIPELLPGMAYLAVLPQCGRAEAVRVSERAARLLEAGKS